jgi:hypothetical protein
VGGIAMNELTQQTIDHATYSAFEITVGLIVLAVFLFALKLMSNEVNKSIDKQINNALKWRDRNDK